MAREDEITFQRIVVDGRIANWLMCSDGRVIPYCRGGDGEENDAKKDDDAEKADGDSGDEAKDDAKKDDDAKGDTDTVTMTRAELDAQLAKARVKAKKAAEEEVKQAAERAKMDDAERAKAEKADAEKASAELVATANKRIVKTEAKVAALAAGVKPDRMSPFMRLVDLDDIEVDDEGEVDEAALKKAIEAALKDAPEFKGTPGKGGASGGEFGKDGEQKKATTMEDAVNQRLAKTG